MISKLERRVWFSERPTCCVDAREIVTDWTRVTNGQQPLNNTNINNLNHVRSKKHNQNTELRARVRHTLSAPCLIICHTTNECTKHYQGDFNNFTLFSCSCLKLADVSHDFVTSHVHVILGTPCMCLHQDRFEQFSSPCFLHCQ